MSNTVSDSSSPLWRTHAAVLAASSFACLVWSWHAGRDLNWDQRNYVNSDSLLRETGGLIHYSGWRPGPALVLGKIESILDGSTVPNCRSIAKLASATGK